MDEWLQMEELLALAADQGPVAERTLELWRYRGLMPRPERQPGARAVWLYPPGSDRQLLRLIHWRARVRDLELIRIALWAEGFPIEVEGVRGALSAFLDRLLSEVERERPRGDASEVAATVDAIAEYLAAKRGHAIVPHVVRMSASERRRAYGYFLSVMFGLDDEIKRRGDDAVYFQRMIGLRSGHGGGLAAALPFDIGETNLVRLPPPAEIRAAVAEASEDELEFVRRMVQLMVFWTPILLPLFTVHYGKRADPFIRVMRRFANEPPAGFFPLLIAALLAALRAKSPDGNELREHLAALAPGPVDLELLKLIPAENRSEALRILPLDRQDAVIEELKAQPRRQLDA